MSPEWDPISDMPSLRGKIAIVTGGNAGIGLSTVKYLALKGCKVYLAARSEDKARKAIEGLVKAHLEIDKSLISWLPLDLSDLGNVTKAVERLKTLESKIDLLFNNAGMATSSTDTLGAGWEMHMAVNHVGHFVFTNGVLPLLKNALNQKDADVRIITLTSSAIYALLPSSYLFNFMSPTFLKEPMTYYPWQWRYIQRRLFYADMIRYAVSKVANMMFAQQLQLLFDQQNLPILSVGVHPGQVASDTAFTLGNVVFRLMIKTTFITPDLGSITSLFAATAKEVRQNPSMFGGKYLEPYGKLVSPPKVFSDKEQVEAMWSHTTTEVNKYLQSKGLPILQDW